MPNRPLRNWEVFNNANFQWEYGQHSLGKHPGTHIPLPHPAHLRGGSLRVPSPSVGEFLLTHNPSSPKPAFLVGQEPECLQEELQGCSWENRSSDTQPKEPNPPGGFQTQAKDLCWHFWCLLPRHTCTHLLLALLGLP